MENQTEIEQALNLGFTEPVRDALWGHIYLTPQLKAITRSNPFMRMHRIAQLGPASIIYPGATHTRAAHSIGVYHVTRRILCTLVKRGAAETSCRFTFHGIRSMLCAALLHDVGHFPFAHSLKELPLKEHEQLSAEIINSKLMGSLIEAAGGDKAMTAAIVDTATPVTGTDAEITFYRRLLSGVLDPDKLDYLNRDARYCGIPYGAQDLDFILSMLYPHKERGIGIDKRGITSVESVLFSKYLMYRSVYWHPSVRSADAMIKKALFAALSCGIISANQLYQLDDQELFALMREKSSSLSVLRLGEDVRQGKLYVCAAEFPYNEAEHSQISDISGRTEFEKRIAAELSNGRRGSISADHIIIDLPDPVNFETGLFEEGEDCFFKDSSTCFSKETVSSFVKALRIVRIFVDQDIIDDIKDDIKGVYVSL